MKKTIRALTNGMIVVRADGRRIWIEQGTALGLGKPRTIDDCGRSAGGVFGKRAVKALIRVLEAALTENV